MEMENIMALSLSRKKEKPAVVTEDSGIYPVACRADIPAEGGCPDCGVKLIRLGSCFTCPACGWGGCG